jgi:hypothetical protein
MSKKYTLAIDESRLAKVMGLELAAGGHAVEEARAAAWAAARQRLAATRAELQRSAVALVERMIAAEAH